MTCKECVYAIPYNDMQGYECSIDHGLRYGIAGFIIWILSFLLRFRFTIRLAEIGGSVAFAIEGAYTVHCMKE